MKLTKRIKTILTETDRGKILFYKVRQIKDRVFLKPIDDYKFISNVYKKRFGVPINLGHPSGISEKLQWLKLFYRNPNIVRCSDKLMIREYLKEHNLAYLANDILAIYETKAEIDQLDLKSLPDSFVVKATHGSSLNLVVKDKSKVNWKLWKKIFKQWLDIDYSLIGREWNYHEMKPRIIIERFIDYDPLIEYKINCLNGIPRYFQINREIDGVHLVDFYNMELENLGIMIGDYPSSRLEFPKTPRMEELLEIAKVLSKEFPLVRVDFYTNDKKIILGELTFFTGGGLVPFHPDGQKYETLWGSYLKLPEPNFNLELYQKISGAHNGV